MVLGVLAVVFGGVVVVFGTPPVVPGDTGTPVAARHKHSCWCTAPVRVLSRNGPRIALAHSEVREQLLTGRKEACNDEDCSRHGAEHTWWWCYPNQ